MSLSELADQYFTYDSRLASFQTVHHKRRGSSANSKASKALSWPHKSLSPESLAKAGFFFSPASTNPDNVTCFLCHKSLDGWEAGDDPLDEHIKHSPDCGWAIVAAVEAEYGNYATENPAELRMIEARKATFADKWPHDGKKGWKCKSKQLVDAGWKYTPTRESDDMVTCTYCQLALDGWEPADKPLNEHYNRAPACPFFALLNDSQGPKKSTKGKASRVSKTSRLSTQSVATVAELDNTIDPLAAPDDSVLTTTSMAGKKGRAKKTTAKSRKTKAKKDEAPEEPDVLSQDIEMPPPPPPKPARGRKRNSDAMEEPETTAVAPAPKKRATRGRGSNTVESSVLDSQTDVEMAEGLPAKPAAGKKGRTSKSTRSVSATSIASTASTASLRVVAPMGDDELDRQLEADLDRPLTDDEGIMMDSDSERKRVKQAKKTTKTRARKGTTASQESNDFAMFDPTPAVPDEAAIDAELKAMEAEHVEKEEAPLKVPKKGRTAGTRKASKQKKAEAPAPPAAEDEVGLVPDVAPEPEEPAVNGNPDDTITSVGTVANAANAGKKRGRPAKKSNEGQVVQEAVPKAEAETVAINAKAGMTSAQEAKKADALEPSKALHQPLPLAKAKLLPPPPPSVPRQLPEPPATPGRPQASPAGSARQPVVSPSPSPQSSDAENQPPSSKPSGSIGTKRVALAPVAVTPIRAASPSKRNVIAGLRSQTPWAAVDLDLVFATGVDQSPNKENNSARARTRFLHKGSELTSAEKRMTVEEWIYHNAGQAEQELKHQCESLVSRFETEGTRAMTVLEGLVTSE